MSALHNVKFSVRIYVQNVRTANFTANRTQRAHPAEALGLPVVIKFDSRGKRTHDSNFRRKAKQHLKRARQIGWETIKSRFQKDVWYREMMMTLYKFNDRNIDEFESLSHTEGQSFDLPWKVRGKQYGIRKRTAVMGMEDKGVWEQWRGKSSSSQTTWGSNSWWSNPRPPWREDKYQ